jgi:hypothetical protein
VNYLDLSPMERICLDTVILQRLTGAKGDYHSFTQGSTLTHQIYFVSWILNNQGLGASIHIYTLLMYLKLSAPSKDETLITSAYK